MWNQEGLPIWLLYISQAWYIGTINSENESNHDSSAGAVSTTCIQREIGDSSFGRGRNNSPIIPETLIENEFRSGF